MIAPCIVCGAELDGYGHYIEGSEPYFNQPDGGTGFTTEGHYGSTVFDPMNGNTLSISVCDPCLTTAGEMGRVLLGRNWKPVVAAVDGLRRPTIVGQVPVHRALTIWDPHANVEQNEEGDDARVEIEPEEVGVIDGVQWWPAFDPARRANEVSR
jgi:hypothetical protein